jgi:hypothetical protein
MAYGDSSKAYEYAAGLDSPALQGKYTPLYPILSQLNSIHNFRAYNFNIVLQLTLVLRNAPFISIFTSKVKEFFICLTRTASHTHLAPLYFITLIVAFN